MKGLGITTLQRELLRRFRRVSKDKSFTVECSFPNDDVPNFLKRLDEFERRSAKTRTMVKAGSGEAKE